MAWNNNPVAARWETQQSHQGLHERQIGLHEDSDPDTLPVPHRSRSPYYHLVRFGVRLSEWWFPEILSFLLAGGLFGLHICILMFFDNQPIEAWDNLPRPNPFDSIQSLINFLSTLMKGALGLPVTSAIGQWKWHQYRHKARPLDELDRFDKASRGMMGSVSFLLSEKFWTPASLGCAIIISGVFFGPTLQNTIRTGGPPKLIVGEPSFLKVADRFDSYLWSGESNEERLLVSSTTMQASISRAWSYGMSYDTGPVSGPTDDIRPDCPVNVTCAWEDWSTLWLMSECVNASVGQSSHNEISAAATPGTVREINYNGTKVMAKTIFNMAASIGVPSTSAFLQTGWHILGHVGVVGDFNGDEEPEAVECVLYWGARQGNSTWRNGYTISEMEYDLYEPVEIVSDESNLDTRSTYGNVTFPAPGPCNFNTSVEAGQDPSETTCDFTITDLAQRALWNTLDPYLTGYAMHFFDEETGQDSIKGSNQAADLFLWDWINERSYYGGSLLDVVDRQLHNLAYEASTTVRKMSTTLYKGTQTDTSLRFAAHYHHLILPGTILAASFVFFVVTAVCTRGQGTWRNSQLPLLYHGLEKTGPREWRNVGATTMWEAACDTLVKLETEGVDRMKGELKLNRYTDDNVRVVEPKGYSRVAVRDVRGD